MKFYLKIRQAFSVLFTWPEVINKAYFFVTIPFLSALLILIGQFIGAGQWGTTGVASELAAPNLSLLSLGLAFLVMLSAVLLNALYQLYLWAVTFFYAQQISEYDWGEFGLSLRELFSDWRVKLSLLAIRAFWYLPLLGIYLLVVAEDMGKLFSLSPGDSSLTAIPELGVIVSATVALFLAQSFVENVLVSLSSYIYAQEGKLLKAFNLLRVLRLFTRSWFEYLVIYALAILPNVVLGVALLLFSIVLSIPLFGGLLLGFLAGLNTLYNTLFLANLQGQVWAELSKSEARK